MRAALHVHRIGRIPDVAADRGLEQPTEHFGAEPKQGDERNDF